jgi:hypothetical protein
MRTMENEADTHRWGTPDKLQGDSYQAGEEVSGIKVLAYLGRLEYEKKNGTIERNATFRVDNKGAHQTWRCGPKNEGLLFKSFGISDPKALIGKSLTFKCKFFPGFQANGLVVMAVK